MNKTELRKEFYNKWDELFLDDTIHLPGMKKKMADWYLNKLASQLEARVSQAACGHWQKEKPKEECYFVYRDNKEDNYPGLYEAKLDDNILCVFNIQDDEFIYTMEEMADGEFYIIEK